MATKNIGRKRDMLLKPLNWMNRSRSSSPAASQNLSASPQTTNTSGSEAPLGPSIILPSSISPLSSPAIYSQLSPNLFNQALSKTNNTTQEWLEKRGLNPNSSDTTHIQDQTKELINLMESTRLLEQSDEPLKVEIANRKIVLREYIADAIAFVTMAGDAAIVFAPPQASAPWAVAKAIMKVPVKTLEQKAALCGTVEWFTRITRRGQIYESLYTTETTDEAAVSNLHNVLLELYTAAVELLAKFDTMARSGAFKEILAVVLSPNYAKDLVSSLLEKEEKVDREIRSCNASRSAISSEEMKIQIKALQKQLAQLSSPLPRIDESVSKLLEKVNKRELEELMNFISSEMFGKSHATVTDTRIEKTGDWLLGSRDFRAWQDIPSSSSVFLLKGAGGTGKTYLTSKVIDHIRKLLEISPHDEGFAYFYCNRSGPSMQQPLVVLQSFVRQLSGKAFDDSGKIQSSLVQKCSKAKREGRELSYKDCEELILESLNLYSKTTVVLDALDESDIETYNLAKYLIQMMEKSERPVKIYISSRPDREYLEEVFKDKFLITVDASNQHDDIQKYLEDKLYSTEKFRGRKQEIQDEIKDIFNTKGCGMFRWVYLQVKSLEKCTSEDAIHNWTRKLPRDLTGAYNQLWENIQERDESDIALAERAIMWVLCAIEPLKSEVLLEAIQYTINGPTVVRKEKQSQQQILSLCQDFLTIDEERGVWMLPHASVAEYFESKGWTGWKCDAFASKVCLGFLENFRPEMIDHRTFAYYIENNWHEHVGRYEEWLGLRSGEGADPDLEAALKRFLGSPDESSDSYRKWVQEYIFDHLRPIDAALFAMCKYGFYYTLRDWWLEGKITEEMAIQKNRHGENSLALAAYGRGSCMPICRHLIDLIDVMHPEADRHARALRNAVDDEKFDIVKLLVMEANADVNFPFSRGECTAQLAAQYYPEMLQWMLDHGRIDLEKENDSGYECGNVLISAAYCGNIDSVRLLLGAGANVNAAVKSGKYGSALVAAVADLYMHSEGKVETVKLLLESGADPNLPLRGGKYGSALEAFALRDQDRIPLWHIFVEAGADPTAVLDRGEHGSALAAAAFDGQKDFLKVMIDHVGADKAINVLRQSRHPNKRNFRDLRHIDRCEDTAVYLANEVGASKDVLLCVGLWDVEPVPAKSGGFEI